MADIEGSHLCAAAPAGGGDGEAHLVEDIHEGQRSRGVRARAGYVGAARTQRRVLISDSAATLQRQSRFVDLPQDIVHRVTDRARHRAVDRGGRGLVLERASVGCHPSRGYGAATQRPQEPLVPVLAYILALDVGESARHALVGIVHRLVDGRTVLRAEAILLVPDVQRCFLKRNGIQTNGFDLHDSVHESAALRMFLTPSIGLQGMSVRAPRGTSSSAASLTGACRRDDSQAPETSPDRVTVIACANTRSCVGVKRLMTAPGCVKARECIL